ncbi:MAG TPA: T9SS type A sorting domain-containing protein [Ignavibacteria bacterium]|jgi:hypothetical protein
MIRKTIFIFFIIPISLLFAQDYWIQKPSPTTRKLTRIQFVDTLYGWASGDSGIVIHTTNSGQSWIIQNTGFTGSIEDMFFLNRSLGWAVGNDVYFTGSKILKTTNGGVIWQVSVYPDTAIVFSAIHFLDSLTGFLSGYTGQIYKTTNGGSIWFPCRFDTLSCFLYQFPKTNINFFNSQTGYACGGVMDLQGIIWKTTDSGLNWFTYCVAPEPFKRIKPLYANKIVATGGDYEFGASVVQSVDGGNRWLYDTTRLFGVGTAFAYRTPSELWIPLSIDTAWALSLDSGGYQKSWYKIYTPNGSFIFDAVFVTPTFGWGCGINGVLIKYNADIIGISENGNKVPEKSALFQNYPNPFNPATTIRFNIPPLTSEARSHGARGIITRLIVYDILGSEIATLVNEALNAGTYEVKWNASAFASGIYFYRLETQDALSSLSIRLTETKKMVILK